MVLERLKAQGLSQSRTAAEKPYAIMETTTKYGTFPTICKNKTFQLLLLFRSHVTAMLGFILGRVIQDKGKVNFKYNKHHQT